MDTRRPALSIAFPLPWVVDSPPSVPSNVLFIPPVVNGIPPTQKPVPLFEYLIRTYTNKGDLVVDCCAGSGTAAVAAINAKRRFICFENAPVFYGMAAERIVKAKEAVMRGEKGK